MWNLLPPSHQRRSPHDEVPPSEREARERAIIPAVTPSVLPPMFHRTTRQLPEEEPKIKKKELREGSSLSNFLFQMLLPDAPEGVEVSRKSFSMKNLSARNGLLHRIRDTAANLRLVLIAISASMRVCPAGTNRGPQRRETLLGSVDFRSKGSVHSLGSSPGVPKKRPSIFLGWVWGSCHRR